MAGLDLALELCGIWRTSVVVQVLINQPFGQLKVEATRDCQSMTCLLIHLRVTFIQADGTARNMLSVSGLQSGSERVQIVATLPLGLAGGDYVGRLLLS